MSIPDYASKQLEKNYTSMPEVYWKADGLGNQCEQKNMKDYTKLVGFSWGGTAPFDQHTGQRSGRMNLDNVIVYKHIDKSTPLIFDHFARNKVVNKSELVVYEIERSVKGGTQQAVKTLRIELSNVWIQKVDAGTSSEGALLEKVSLNFQKIMIRHEVGSTEAMLDRTEYSS